MDRSMTIGKQVLRQHLADVFAEVACYSTLEANRLMEKYIDYRQALNDPLHPFWKSEAHRMLNEATQVEFGLRLEAEKTLMDEDGLEASLH
jgi:hypothetical protein